MQIPHILIVDDDTRLRQLLAKYLANNGYFVSEAPSAIEAEDFLNLVRVDAIIMDIMMPHKNGDIFTQELRKKGLTTPIIMLTAMGDTNSRITGLEAGADDYLPKPFEPKELLLRLGNLLKHHTPAQLQLPLGPYQYNTQSHLLKKGAKIIALTHTEQTLFENLIQHLNDVVSREQLATSLNLENVRTVDVQINRLRKKLDPTSELNLIQSIRGKGYKVVST